MVDWSSAEGARRGFDLRREQAEALSERIDEPGDDEIDVEALLDELEDSEPGDVLESLPRRPLTADEVIDIAEAAHER